MNQTKFLKTFWQSINAAKDLVKKKKKESMKINISKPLSEW